MKRILARDKWMRQGEHRQGQEMAALACNAQTQRRACIWEVFLSPLLNVGVWSEVKE
jgi:hypothetical protein